VPPVRVTRILYALIHPTAWNIYSPSFAVTEFSEVPTISCSGILSDEAVYRLIQHRLYSARMFDDTWWRTTISIHLFSGIAATGISHQVGRRRRAKTPSRSAPTLSAEESTW
jgi:hypothetical protein